MGSGLSRQEVIDSRWWEERAQHMLGTTPDAGKAGLICSLIAFADETAITTSLTARSDLDTLVALHCQKFPGEQNVASQY